MKKVVFSLSILALIVACNNDPKSGSSETKPADNATASPSSNPDYEAGLALVSQSDCVTCHRVDEVLTGPSYKDIANKYASQAPGIIPTLAEKIIKGGSGNWGSVMMLGHPDVPQADAEKMVKYILTLK